MRKVLFIAFVMMAFVAMGAVAVYACGGNKTASATGAYSCSASKTTSKLVSSSTTSSGYSCSASKTNAKLASSETSSKSLCSYKNSTTSAKLASATCSLEQIKACMASAKASHAENCEYGSECQLTSMSIKGMTCGACENGVKAAFMNVEGVNKVLGVCYEAGFAVVCANPDKASNKVLLKAVNDRGFEAKIIPAVATITNDAKTSTIGSTGKTCGAAKKGTASTTSKTSSAQGTN